jgi:ABC-2 type transport system ATP-binding protein
MTTQARGNGPANAAVRAERLTFRYRSRVALDSMDLAVEGGSVHALLGPNGSGKTTLLRILLGFLRPTAGSVTVLGQPVSALTSDSRTEITYVAEGQRLPAWMSLGELERYLEPLYARWDRTLADSLRDRFSLDPSRRIGALSRGEQMKAALLCALAPRPRLLLMDEPFTGMDVLVKDELVRGLLESAGGEGWTVLIASHDIAEVEAVADSVTIIRHGRSVLSESMDAIRERFRQVEVVMPSESAAQAVQARSGWLQLSRAGARLQFVDAVGGESTEADIRRLLPDAVRVEVRPAALRDVFVATVRESERSGMEGR